MRGDDVNVRGTGFSSNATVTFGAVTATIVGQNASLITVIVPDHPPGLTDIVVSNQAGDTRTLSQWFTVGSVVLSISSTLVAPGDDVTVTWIAPQGRCCGDWIGLYSTGAPNSHYGVWTYTGDSATGAFKARVPIQPGTYEFRYLVQDGYNDAARSGVITVTGTAQGRQGKS